ncbi:MAG: DUF3471 domain-containing protein [Gemmatimonadales bacterium]
MLATRLVVATLCLAGGLVAQTPDTTSFVTTRGKDTTSIEQYVRAGHTITGAWIQHQGTALVHDYTLVLDAEGWPAQYVMSLYTAAPHTFLMSVTYGRDSATRVMVRDSTAVTMRVATTRSYPMAAISILAWDLALTRARAAHADSASIAIEQVEVRRPPQILPVKFFGDDSVHIGPAIWARVDRNGRLLALREGGQETRRVQSLDAARLAAGFDAADAAAKAARVEIPLSPAMLQRLIGEYSLNPTATFAVTFDGVKLMLQAGKQLPIQLFAESPTRFFIKATTAVTLEFDLDDAGNAAGLTLVQGGVRQRAVKMK